MKRILLLLAVVLALCLAGCGVQADVTIDYGESALYTREDMDAGTEPHVVSDADGLCVDQPVFPLLRIKRMSCRMEVTSRADEHMVSELDFCPVQDRKAMIGEAFLPEADVVAVVTPERGIDDGSFTDTAQQFLKDFALRLEIHWRKLVVFVAQVLGVPYLVQEIRFRAGIIELPGIPFFFFSHCSVFKWRWFAKLRII